MAKVPAYGQKYKQVMLITDSTNTTRSRQKGISLIEILLALAILMTIAVYLSRMVRFIDAGDKAEQCLVRMNHIAIQIKNFYRGRQTLPEPATDPSNSVPVQQLNLSQKHRLDTWGQYFEYRRSSDADIVGFRVDGRKAAGVLISLGPDQEKDYEGIPEENPEEFTTRGDDRLLPITVEKEAWEIVMAELEVLDKQVMAYDRVFAGIENGGGDIYVAPTANMPDPSYSYGPAPPMESFYLVDEDGCVAANSHWFGGEGCLPTRTDRTFNPDVYDPDANDPNCGRATIDACASRLENILVLYGLADDTVAAISSRYYTDPWGHAYEWGNGDPLSSKAVLKADRRYHVFYSRGPDGLFGTDDDITPP
ncbi:MAG: hypothetical protein SRB2_02550 [Desulfobacteraceae bacterium Eth-SRB2]|nr:MAG: hypothetical protein SRB2_02550 [Desulfobacteraceae bacterium Eth-SRB2]